MSDRALIFEEMVKDDVPEIADNVMRQDLPLRETIVTALRMRLVIEGHSDIDNFLKTPDGTQIHKLLQRYGSEFTGQLDERRFDALVIAVRAQLGAPSRRSCEPTRAALRVVGHVEVAFWRSEQEGSWGIASHLIPRATRGSA